jgi:hypothetical protein
MGGILLHSSQVLLLLLALVLRASAVKLETRNPAVPVLKCSPGPCSTPSRLGNAAGHARGVLGGVPRVASLRGGAEKDLVIGVDGGTESIRASVFRPDGCRYARHVGQCGRRALGTNSVPCYRGAVPRA